MRSVTALHRLAALSLALACGCARTTDSTETGNPPVIDAELVALVAESGEVHVVGEPKAVRPGGVELEVKTVSSGELSRGMVAADGSLDVAVDGTLDDTYRLRAIGAKASSEPVYLGRDGVIDTPDGGVDVDGGTLMCLDRMEAIRDRIVQIEADADRSCSSSYDCGETAAPDTCPYFCRGVALAHASASEVGSALAAIGTSLCEPFEADGCSQGLPVPSCALPPPIGCVDAQCTRCEGASCPETSCDACTTPLITWSTRGSTEGPGVSGATYMLEDCSTLTFTPVGDLPSCSRTLPCVPRNASDSEYTAAHVQNALGHPDVQAALAAGTNFGAITPAGFGFSLSVGDDGIFVSETPCKGPAPCIEEPEAVAYLRSVLQRVAVDPAPCASGPVPAAECSLDFDPGTGSASEGVYAFDTAIGTCVPEVYSGVGGNANRFDTIDDCRASCPTTAAADACPSDRVFVEQACLQCGPVGGCPELAPICGLPCTDTSECQNEFWLCFDGICRAGGCE